MHEWYLSSRLLSSVKPPCPYPVILMPTRATGSWALIVGHSSLKCGTLFFVWQSAQVASFDERCVHTIYNSGQVYSVCSQLMSRSALVTCALDLETTSAPARFMSVKSPRPCVQPGALPQNQAFDFTRPVRFLIHHLLPSLTSNA